MCERFVVLKSVSTGEVSWSTAGDRNPERMADGTIGYEVVAYADSAEEAQDIWKKHNPFFGALLS